MRTKALPPMPCDSIGTVDDSGGVAVVVGRAQLIPQDFELVAHIDRGLPAAIRGLDQAAPDQPLQFRRKSLVVLADGARFVLDDARQFGDGRFTWERRGSSGHFVEDHPKREDVGGGTGLETLSLFRSHVMNGSDDPSLDRHVHAGRRTCSIVRIFEEGGGELGKTEIKDRRLAAIIQNDVVGLHVTMGDATVMCRGEGVGDGNHDLEDAGDRHGAFGTHDFAKRPARDELHCEEGVFADRFEGMDRDDAGVLERGQCLGLALETSTPLRIA